jgi:transketolase
VTDRVRELQRIAEWVRLDIVDTLGATGCGHPGSSLSLVELLVTLYFDEMQVRPEDPKWAGRDRFVLSKGHGALALYAVLSRRGFFPRDELFTFESLGSRLQGHPDALLTPGVEMSTGSLGQGLSVALGMAIGARLLNQPARAYAILGDGECQEGNVWEAAMAAAKFQADNLVAIIDYNNLQGGVTREVMPSLEPFAAKWQAFGWHVLDVPGHDVPALLGAYAEARATSGRPTVIIARTVKGNGVSFMENRVEWHGRQMTPVEYQQALGEVRLRLSAYQEVS